MKSFRTTFIFCCLLAILYCSFHIYRIEKERRVIKEDLIEVSKIKYGLFNIDQWESILSLIITCKIEELNLSPDQREDVRVKITQFLNTIISDFENRFYEDKSKSVKGWFQGSITNLTGMFTKIKQDIPVFTEQILDFLSHEDNREKVKGFIIEKFTTYTDETFSKLDYTEYNRILCQYKYEDCPRTIKGLKANVDQLERKAKMYSIPVIFLAIVCGLMVSFNRNVSKTEYLLYTLICFSLLFIGLFLPMIEIDARLEAISFTLFGEPVEFRDQVLYYKSKSITEVVHLMLSQGKWDVFMVGILVLTFSVLFPITKLLSSLVFIYFPGVQSNRIIRFMVFRTGKWSMADVMVIAIFMSYIGFSSILTEQLRHLESLSNSIDILTTNESALQIGFFLFTSFAMLSLLIAHKLQYAHSPVKET
jgi:paraquat-inducible protein A